MKGCIIKRGDSWRLKFDAGRNAHGKRQFTLRPFAARGRKLRRNSPSC